MEMKLELVPVPVTDDDRAKAFYTDQVGFKADHDHKVNEGLRFIQLTPPGSACSIVIGTGTTTMKPGTQSVQLVVTNVDTARAELTGRGVAVSEIANLPWGRFVHFNDPDGNTWSVQEIQPKAAA